MITRYNQDGQYLSVTARQAPSLPEHGEPPLPLMPAGAIGFYDGIASLFTQYHDFKSGRPAEMGAKPSPSHVFNYRSKRWEADLAQAWELARIERTRLLTASDWVMLRAGETGVAASQVWIDYRQALRDVTSQPDPLNLTWPDVPI